MEVSSTITIARVRPICIIAILLACCAISNAGEKVSEETAVDQLKRATASQIDPSLPSRPFGAWVTDKFEGWDVQWELHDCGPGGYIYTGKKEIANDVPVCVQVNIMQPAQKIHGEESNGFHVLFQVGTAKKGFLPAPRVRVATRKDGDEVEKLKSMSEVEP